MAYQKARDHESAADDRRRRGDFAEAGDQFSAAAYAYLGLADSLPTTGLGITNTEFSFLPASVCYRLDARPDRATNRCKQGILIAEDVLERTLTVERPENSYDQARQGAPYEFIGDLRLLGQLDGVESAYDEAIRVYETAGDPNTGYSEQEHMRLMSFLDLVGSGVGQPLDDEWRTGMAGATLTDWVEHKRAQLPVVLDQLLEKGSWRWEQ